MDIDTRLLRGFVEIASERGSFTRAAGKLHITQPTLSGRIQKLEARLGVKLFERSGSITLTKSGLELLPIAKRLIGELEEFDGCVNHLRRGSRSCLRVGCAPFMLQLPQRYELVANFLEKNQGVTARVVLQSQPEIVRLLGEGELDVAIFLGWPASSTGQTYSEVSKMCAKVYPDKFPHTVVTERPFKLLVPNESRLCELAEISPSHLHGSEVASFDLSHSPLLLRDFMAKARPQLITPPEAFPFGAERFARRERVPVLSHGFTFSKAPDEQLFQMRPLEGVIDVCQIVVLASPNAEHDLGERFMRASNRK